MTSTCVMASTYPFGILKLVVSRHMTSICVMESTTLHYDVYYVLWQPPVLCHHIKSTCVTSGMSSYAVYMCYGVYHIVLWRLPHCTMTSTHVLWRLHIVLRRLHMCYDHTCVTLFSVMVSSSMTTGVCESTKRETILC